MQATPAANPDPDPDPDRCHRILVVMFSRAPSYDGDYVRFQNIFPRLAKTNELTLLYLDAHDNQQYSDTFAQPFHRTTIFPYKPASDHISRIIDSLTLQAPQSLRHRDPTLLEHLTTKVRRLVTLYNIELILCWSRAAQQFLTDVNVPVLFDLCDAVSLQLREDLKQHRSLRFYLYYLRFFRFESQIVARYPTTFVAKKDARWFSNSRHSVVIANGVDLETHCTADMSARRNTIIFFGSMAFRPNIEAALYFSQEVMPILRQKIPAISWYIVGNRPVPEVQKLAHQPNTIVTGAVDDIRSHICSSQVVVAPMISGSGIKNKVLEAMALRRPVVATPLGLDGLDCKPGVHALAAETPRDFATSIAHLLENPLRRQEIADAARGHVEENFSWTLTAFRYNQLFAELINQAARGAGAEQ